MTMTTIVKALFLSGWFQLIVLTIIFIIYSRRVIARHLMIGYALGWLMGLFFMLVYVSLRPPHAFYLGRYDYNLNIFQVLMSSLAGILVGVFMVVMTSLFRRNSKQQALSTAAVTGVFVVAIFMHLIASPELRLMVSLFILAFGMCMLASYIVLARGNRSVPVIATAASAYPDDVIVAPVRPRSRLDEIREKVTRRVNMNDVPTNYPNTM